MLPVPGDASGETLAIGDKLPSGDFSQLLLLATTASKPCVFGMTVSTPVCSAFGNTEALDWGLATPSASGGTKWVALDCAP